MDDEMRKYWDRKLVEMIEQEPLFKSTDPVTWKLRLHNRWLDLIDSIYHKLTGSWPHEE